MVFVTLLLALPAVVVMLYVALSIPAVQNIVRARAERELTNLLGTEVCIGKVDIAPFNRLTVTDVTVLDDSGQTALTVDRLGAGISLTDLVVNRHVVVSYAELIGFHINVYKDSLAGQLNVAPIIARLKSNDSSKKSDFELAVTTVVIRHGSMEYNVLDCDTLPPGVFDRNHIAVSEFRADVKIPTIGSQRIAVDVKRLAARERSGLILENLRMNFETGEGGTRVTDMVIDLPQTYLAFNDINVSVDLTDLNPEALLSASVSLSTLAGSAVALSDLSPFYPPLDGIGERVSVELDVAGTLDSLAINRLELLSDSRAFSLLTHGTVIGALTGADALRIDLQRFNLTADGPQISNLLSSVSHIAPSTRRLLLAAGEIDLLTDLTLSLHPLTLTADGTLMCEAGSIDLNGRLMKPDGTRGIDLTAAIESYHFDLSTLSGPTIPVSDLSLSVHADGHLDGKNSVGNVDLTISDLLWDGRQLGGINATAEAGNRQIAASVRSGSSLMRFDLDGLCDFSESEPSLLMTATVDTLSTAPFVRSGRFADTRASFRLDADVKGLTANTIAGQLRVTDLTVVDRLTGRKAAINSLLLENSVTDNQRQFVLASDVIDGNVIGSFTPTTLGSTFKNIFAEIYPALLTPVATAQGERNELTYELTLKPDSVVTRFFNLPVEVISPLTISGFLSSSTRQFALTVDAPYFLQKSKLIENSSLHLTLDGADQRSDLFLSTVMPTKHGPMTLSLTSDGHNNRTDTGISWHVSRESDYHGDFRFSTAFARDSADATLPLLTTVNVNPSTMIFNDTAWTVSPSRIDISKTLVKVDNFHAGREGQHIIINGTASKDSADVIRLQLLDIDLDYVFETLNIPNVMFGGSATGDFYVSQLMTGIPVMFTDNLSVEGLSYNSCVMGNGKIRSAWHPEDASISIYADIDQSDGRHSIIDGRIRPMAEELDFKFYADRARIGFLKPFMSAFATDVSGFASGFAHLYGTFKLIDLKGNILAEDLNMKLGFTNTDYSVARDSVYITPGRIEFSDVVLTDRYGHEALLSGYVLHKCFKEPEFRFDITDATDFLCYDVSERQTADPWYGTIYGNGGVTVLGYPGMVDIGVRMSTAPNSTFTFVLSDSESATEYDFITFHDRDKARKDSIAALDPTAAMINAIRARRNVEEQGAPTEYVMDFNVDVTPAATLNLVMDPIGGDRIRANGQGHFRMNYVSTGELKMFGEYILSRGNYNFTLQDIIIKDFTIEEGSKIKFNGNPYAAQLDIRAAYTVNANLTDLDESFSQDKELNRTNVPVNAMLLVTGDMRQPDINFDLRFPTLTHDVDRKVRSIVSTEDMMNRQIIYLLALNRFYTPDYMNATRGNELVSVASSTISSQLSSMLGQLSDKWSISPNFRSDRGDFSDVEVDVALSSHLLNNRLLLNGNFGYRDKSLNNNSFIGDFDIRYLLNRSGSISLKAYNRYNDQNYYLKSALTTQGVGVVFKRDFDNIFSFLRPLLRKKKATEPSDSSAVVTEAIEVTDSITVAP